MGRNSQVKRHVTLRQCLTKKLSKEIFRQSLASKGGIVKTCLKVLNILAISPNLLHMWHNLQLHRRLNILCFNWSDRQ